MKPQRVWWCNQYGIGHREQDWNFKPEVKRCRKLHSNCGWATVRPEQKIAGLDHLINYMTPHDHEPMACYEPEVNAGPCEFCMIQDLLKTFEEVKP